MFYRPHFCCHCGEKIVRAKWTPLSSRRFCEFCEIEQKQHDLLPRAAMVVAILFGAAGLTSYFRGSDGSSATVRSPQGVGPQTRESGTAHSIKTGSAPPTNSSNQAAVANTIAVNTNAEPANKVQLEPRQNSSTQPVYYCGAMTKKGTPCTRRVKIKGRCWQHADRATAEISRN